MQMRRHSLAEAFVQPIVGYFVALAVQIVAFPWFGIHVSLGSNVKLGAIFFAASVGRSYLIRRWFARKTEAA